MGLKERLIQFIDYKGISVQQFEKNTNLSNGAVSKMGDNTRKSTLDKISSVYPELNINWVLTGENNMLNISKNEAKIIIPNIYHVPLISKYAYAGYLNGFEDDEYMDTLPTMPFIVEEGKMPHGEYIAIEVKGDSMDDGSINSLQEGDILFCRFIHPDLYKNTRLHISKWNFVIVSREDGIIVKRIVNHDVERGIITVHSLNPLYQDYEIDLRDVVKIFNVVQFQRKPTI